MLTSFFSLVPLLRVIFFLSTKDVDLMLSVVVVNVRHAHNNSQIHAGSTLVGVDFRDCALVAIETL